MQHGSRLLIAGEIDLAGETWNAILAERGFTVTTAASAQEFEFATARLAGSHAQTICLTDPSFATSVESSMRQLAREGRIGVVIIAPSNDTYSRIKAFEIGAHAFLVKPIEPQALFLALQKAAEALSNPSLRRPISFDALIDADTWQLTAPNGVTIALTCNEWLLLKVLDSRRGLPVSRRAIAEILGDTARATDNNLEAITSRLRRKIQEACPGWDPLRTVRKCGYAYLPYSFSLR